MFKFWLSSPLYEAVTDGGAPGGGGGAPPPNPPSDGGAPGGDDPTLATYKLSDLRTLLTETVTGAVNGLDAKLQAQFKKLTPAAAAPPPPPAPKPKDGKAEDPEFTALRESNELLQKEIATERSTRLKSQEDSALKDALQPYAWQDNGQSIAYGYYRTMVTRGENSELLIDGKPLETFIKGSVPTAFKPYLQAKPVGGAGAGAGGAGGANGVPQLEDIKPGMDPKVMAAASKAVAALVTQHQNL